MMLKSNIKIKAYWFHIIGWLCFLCLPLIISTIEFKKVRPEFIIRFFQGPLVFYLNYFLLVPFLLLRKRIPTYIFLSILLIILVNYGFNLISPSPPFEQLQNLRGIPDNLNIPSVKTIKIAMSTVFSFAFFLLGGVIRIMLDYYKNDRIYKEREMRRTETELQFLKAQLNPHFLFNSLNSIYSLVRNKSNDASEAVITLSELMRYMLYEANQEKVKLDKEIDYLKNYVTLQRLRLSNSENVKLQITGDLKNKYISPLLLISFIENAFKYGTNYKGVTDVCIKVIITDNELHFHISNIIGSYRKDRDNSGVGLENIGNRLRLLYENSHKLTIDKTSERYTVNLFLNLK